MEIHPALSSLISYNLIVMVKVMVIFKVIAMDKVMVQVIATLYYNSLISLYLNEQNYECNFSIPFHKVHILLL